MADERADPEVSPTEATQAEVDDAIDAVERDADEGDDILIAES
ncbi:hypothetical protein [Natrinema sp. 1APR25-10V2]|nr:hypothetical protein [Natrinema sp. 1APR25-10V2]